MQETAKKLREILKFVLPLLRAVSENDASARPDRDKWSKKEILGHLVDSACNNQQKFVRTMAGSGINFVGYQQNHWVDSQKYGDARWLELIDFFNAYNLHIAHIIEHVEPELLANTITIDSSGPFTLEFIMKDYVEHLVHHIKQVLPEAELDSDFKNIYNA